MNTYFNKNIKDASFQEIGEIVVGLSQAKYCLATIQWNEKDDSLYGVSWLDESVVNPSDNGHIWHYEPASELLTEILQQLKPSI